MVIPLIPAIASNISDPNEEAKRVCLEKGGFWNSKTKTCRMPEVEPTPAPTPAPTPTPPPTKLTTPETFTDPRTGRASGITLPNGKTYLGLSPDEVQQVATGEQQRVARPEGTQPVGTQANLMQDAQRKLQSASQVGKIDFATASQLDELGINWRETFLAGTSSIVPSALGYAAAGAGAGLVTGGAASAPLAAIGAVAGAIKGFYTGVNNNIKAQKGDLISGKTTELKKRQTALQNYISAANTNPAEADTFVQAFNTELSLIRKDYNSLHKEANEDLTYWGGQDGTPQLIAYEIFFESVEPSLKLRMEQAVLKPDPTRAYLSAEDMK